MLARNPEPNTILLLEETRKAGPESPFTFAKWAPLIYILITGLAEALFVELYCHWHGGQFLFPDPRKLYSPENIAKLSHIDFVARTGPNPTDPPTVMSMAAEILMWSSLGIWAQRISGMVTRYEETPPNVPHDLATYIGILGCQTGVVAGVLILLRLSNFHIFNVSVDNFEATVGLAFLLGYFGDETIRFFGQLRTSIFKSKSGNKDYQL
jgi:hypothetical protein